MSKLLASAIQERKANLLSSNIVTNRSTKDFPSHQTFNRSYFYQEQFGTAKFFTAVKEGFNLNTYYYYAGAQVENFIQHEKIVYASFLTYEPHDGMSYDDELSLAEIEKLINTNQKVDMCSLNSMELIMDLGNELFCYISMNSDSKCGGIAYFKTSDSAEEVVKNLKATQVEHETVGGGKIFVVSGEYLRECPFDGSPYSYTDEWFLKEDE